MRDLSMIVSADTLKSEDVVPKMIDAYRDIANYRHGEMDLSDRAVDICMGNFAKWEREANALIERAVAIDDMPAATAWAESDAINVAWSYLWDEVADALNDIVGHDFYFGASDGDGALFGIWPVHTDDDADPDTEAW